MNRYLPGSRAPHANVIKNEVQISLLDLFEADFVLLIAEDGQAWKDAAQVVAQTISFPLITYRIANDSDLIDPENEWKNRYDMTPTGAVLIRPDGHIAWRSKSIVQNPKDVLHQVLHTLIQF